MKMAQMMEPMKECLVAIMEEMRTNQAKADANLKETKEEIMTDLKTQIGCLASCIYVNQEKAEACDQEMMVIMETCLGQMKAMNLEASPEEIESEVEHEEVPEEEAAVETLGALKKWYGARDLAVGCRWQLKKQTQGDCGSWKKLAAACREITRHAGVLWHKGRGHIGPAVEQR
jgi:hypothetical protein